MATTMEKDGDTEAAKKLKAKILSKDSEGLSEKEMKMFIASLKKKKQAKAS